ncbi:MAG: hypothetical protein AB4040_05715 [Synechococcus sp.]
MAHGAAIDMAIRDYYAEDMLRLSQKHKKEKRLDRTIDRLRAHVKVTHEKH